MVRTEPLFCHRASWLASESEICLNAGVKIQVSMLLLSLAMAHGIAFADDKTIEIDDGRLSIALPPGWKESEQEQKGTGSIGGYESSDRKTSFYLIEIENVTAADDVFGALDRTVANFDADENWIVKNIGKTRDVTIDEKPAAYCQVELDLVAGEREVPFVFHFTMVGAKDSFFLLQGSTMKPVRGVREQELFRMMRSFRILKE